MQVHQAVILPLCPLLGFMCADTSRDEDPCVTFPEDSADVIQAFVDFLYEGNFRTSEGIESVDDVLRFMGRIGLVLPPGSFEVITVHKISPLITLPSPILRILLNYTFR